MSGTTAAASGARRQLDATTESLNKLRDEFDTFRSKTTQQITALREHIRVGKSRNEELLDRVAYLEELAGISVQSGGEGDGQEEQTGGDTAGAGAAEGGEQGQGDGATADTSTAVVPPVASAQRFSDNLKGSKEIRDVVAYAFQRQLGVSSLMPKNLPEYPSGIGRLSPTWPKDSLTNLPLLRFNWGLDDARTIHENLEEVLKWIRANGALAKPESAASLSAISDQHLRERITEKHTYMARGVAKLKKNAEKLAEREEERRRREEELEDIAEEEEDDEQVLSTAAKNARADAILKQRLRKRPESSYTDEKYDAAFILNAMSTYENPPGQQGKACASYIERKPFWRSETLEKLYEEIDALPDPRPDHQIKPRVVGAPTTHAPIKARKLATRIRAWQVKDTVLEVNGHWLTTGRVSMSGIAWGDKDDPVDEEKGKGRAKPSTSQQPRRVMRKSTSVEPNDEGLFD